MKVYSRADVSVVSRDGLVQLRRKSDDRALFTIGTTSEWSADELTDHCIDALLVAYVTGLRDGVETGKAHLRDEIRELLGLNK